MLLVVVVGYTGCQKADMCLFLCLLQSLVMDFNLLTDSEARSPALSLSDSGTPQHDQGCKGQDNSGQLARNIVCLDSA